MQFVQRFHSMFKISESGPIAIGRIDEFQLKQKYCASQMASTSSEAGLQHLW